MDIEGITMFIAILICYAIGYFVGKEVQKRRRPEVPNCGNLVIEFSDPDGPYVFFEATESIDYIKCQDKIELNVDPRGLLGRSQ